MRKLTVHGCFFYEKQGNADNPWDGISLANKRAQFVEDSKIASKNPGAFELLHDDHSERILAPTVDPNRKKQKSAKDLENLAKYWRRSINAATKTIGTLFVSRFKRSDIAHST
eukprot:gb/GECG01001704.1/.p1 GENE.gb/GECG01001704.1/~~gb/GECG01001704.1/.p1  ORF type:complete len:113 (+),score=19.75 gb/GECG01001704.1/:1-339(+)